ncbi:MAG: phosphatase PAP2 family protein [bacterium]
MANIDEKLTIRIHKSGLSDLGLWQAFSIYGIWVFALVSFVMTQFLSWRELIFFVFVPVSVAFTLTFIIRSIVRRPRPNMGTGYNPWLRSWSFPSAHASVSFTFATSLAMLAIEFDGLVGATFAVVALFFAGLISISRIMVGVHYFADIIAGALLGIAVAIILV